MRQLQSFYVMLLTMILTFLAILLVVFWRQKDGVKRQTIGLKDALFTTMYTPEPLIKLLVRKGIITEEELLEEIKKIKNKKAIPLAQKRSYSIGLGFSRFLFIGNICHTADMNGLADVKTEKRRRHHDIT